MKTTIGKLRTCQAIARQFENKKTKFGFACLKAVEKIKTALKKEDEEVDKKRHELALTGEKGELLFGEKGEMKFTKENYKTLDKFIELQNEIEVEYEPYFATDLSSVKDSPALINEVNGVIVDVNIEDFYNE